MGADAFKESAKLQDSLRLSACPAKSANLVHKRMQASYYWIQEDERLVSRAGRSCSIHATGGG